MTVEMPGLTCTIDRRPIELYAGGGCAANRSAKRGREAGDTRLLKNEQNPGSRVALRDTGRANEEELMAVDPL
jgi:hypothetical protein